MSVAGESWGMLFGWFAMCDAVALAVLIGICVFGCREFVMCVYVSGSVGEAMLGNGCDLWGSNFVQFVCSFIFASIMQQ